jgi:signal transduction histidine kinase
MNPRTRDAVEVDPRRVGLVDRTVGPAARRVLRAGPWPVAVGVAVALVGLWATAVALGGTDHFGSAWFVLPVVVAAMRLPVSGAVATAVVACILSGPLLMDNAEAGIAQEPHVWLSRGVVFLLTALLVAFLSRQTASDHRREAELAEERRRLAEEHRELATRQAAVVATVSHELRTPLTIIGGAARTLEMQSMVSPEGAEFIEAIHVSTRRLTDLVNTVAAVMEDEPSFLRREPIFLAELLPSVLTNIAVRDVRHRVRIEQPGEPVVFESDRELLAQLLRHVIENALRFSPPDAAVDVAVEHGEGRLAVEVCDRGPGIDPTILERAEPFAQGDATLTRGTGGLGLGLFAASRLAVVLGGNLTFSPRPGGGTITRIELAAPLPGGALAPSAGRVA